MTVSISERSWWNVRKYVLLRGGDVSPCGSTVTRNDFQRLRLKMNPSLRLCLRLSTQIPVPHLLVLLCWAPALGTALLWPLVCCSLPPGKADVSPNAFPVGEKSLPKLKCAFLVLNECPQVGLSGYLQVSFTLPEMGCEVFRFWLPWLPQWTLKVQITKLMLLQNAFFRVYEQFREQNLQLMYSLNHHLRSRKCPKDEAIFGPCRWLHSARERQKKKNPQSPRGNEKIKDEITVGSHLTVYSIQKCQKYQGKEPQFINLSICCFLKKRNA